MINEFEPAFTAFMNEAFEDACESSTRASWGGSGYSVELFDDGTYRVLWNNDIGNLYDSPGLVIGIPALGDDDWDEDETQRFYDNAEDAMREYFNEVSETRYSDALAHAQ